MKGNLYQHIKIRHAYDFSLCFPHELLSLIIQEQNTKKNHKRVVVLYVIKNHVNLHKL